MALSGGGVEAQVYPGIQSVHECAQVCRDARPAACQGSGKKPEIELFTLHTNTLSLCISLEEGVHFKHLS